MDGSAHSIKYGILCEDVRREDNGKLIVLGMYGRSIEVSAIPAGLLLTLLIAFESGTQGVARMDTIVLLDDTEISKASGQITFSGDGLALLSLPPLAIPIEKEGDLIFKAKLDDAKWVELWNGKVSLRR